MRWEIEPLRHFPALRVEWEELNRRAGNSPLLRLDFVEPLLQHFATGEERLAVMRRFGRATALAVVVPAGRFSWQTMQPANAPLGLWLAEPGTALEPALSALLRRLPGKPLLLGITQQDPHLLPRPAQGAVLDSMDYITTPSITVTGGFDAYWASRGKNLRQNIRRQINRLERDGVVPRLECLDRPEDMDRAIADYARLETTGWKGEAGSAVRGDDAQGAFYVAMMRRFCATGQGRVYRYFLGSELAASDICLFCDGIFIVLKTAYNEAFSALSPAQLMRHAIFRRLMDEEGCRRIEFYGPLKDWHLRWTDEVRTMYHVNCARWRLVAALRRRRDRPKAASPLPRPVMEAEA